jgi:hypothetical protein
MWAADRVQFRRGWGSCWVLANGKRLEGRTEAHQSKHSNKQQHTVVRVLLSLWQLAVTSIIFVGRRRLQLPDMQDPNANPRVIALKGRMDANVYVRHWQAELMKTCIKKPGFCCYAMWW